MKIKRNEFAAYICVLCLMFYYTLAGAVSNTDSFQVILIIGIASAVMQIIIYTKLNMRSLMVWVGIFALLAIYFFYNSNPRIIINLLAAFCCMNIELKTLLRLLFSSKLVSFLLIFVFGNYGNNSFAFHLGSLILLYLCMRDMKIDYIRFAVLLIVYVIGYRYTNTDAFGVIIGFVLLCTVFINFQFTKKIVSSKIMIWIFPICLFLNYFFAAGVGEKEMPFIGQYLPAWLNSAYLFGVQKLDKFMSSRLSLTKISFVTFGVSFFGGNINMKLLNLDEHSYFYLDSGMMQLLQGWGIIMTVIVMGMTIVFMKYAIDTNNYALIIAGIAIALWGINEDILTSLGNNIIFWCIGIAAKYYLEKRGGANEDT